MRRSFLIVAFIVLAVLCAGGFWFARQRAIAPAEVAAPTELAQTEPAAKTASEAAPAMPKEQVQSPSPVPLPGSVAPIRPEPSPQTRQLVAALTQLKGPITPDQAAVWKTNLTQLIQQGPAAIPANRWPWLPWANLVKPTPVRCLTC